ncbi:MAG: M4 family metallopeptidase [Bacteroidia bacterium]|nr:M4 family metallopeptidase [Bacteroidia bacterium]
MKAFIKKYVLFFLTLYFQCTNCFSQIALHYPLKGYCDENSTLDWLRLKPEVQLTSSELFDLIRYSYMIDEESEFRLESAIEDEVGWTHEKYQQYLGNLKIEGAEFILHLKEGLVIKANGDISIGNFLLPTPQISPFDACTIAYEGVSADSVDWMINHLKSELPFWKMVLAKSRVDASTVSDNYFLCYKVEVKSANPDGSWYAYIEVSTGRKIKILPISLSCIPGNGTTLYNGQQGINSEDRGWPFNDFYLKDDCRAKYIQTMRRTGLSNQNIFDDDNNWPGTNAAVFGIHWAGELTYDYFKSNHARNSVDGKGRRLKLILREDIYFDQLNAYWNTNKDIGNFGGGVSGLSISSLDVVAHEISHGVVFYTSDLEYERESGALNESFADIFGTCVEHFASDSIVSGVNSNWLIGEDIPIGPFRSLSNPKDFDQPDFYEGANWFDFSGLTCSSTNDNCGVHINSGVQNYWFYLLAQDTLTQVPDPITNNPVNVCGIGEEKAANISYRNLRFYLTSQSDYSDARNGAIQAASDLFGSNSFEENQCQNAWHAVGIGGGVDPCALTWDGNGISGSERRLAIFPNPSDNNVSIEFQNNPGEQMIIQLFSPSGVLVKNIFEGMSSSERFSTTFSVRNLSSGIYFCRIIMRDEILIRKLAVQK